MIAGLSKRQARRFHTESRAKRRSPAVEAYPSFVGLKPASPSSSRSKQGNKSRGTKHEVMLQRALRRLGLHFKCNVDSLPGSPDIVISSDKVVVFCDGDFWHGRDWDTLKPKLKQGTNGQYWVSKIQRNIERDVRVTKKLRNGGWRVIRVWESDILSNVQKVRARLVRFL